MLKLVKRNNFIIADSTTSYLGLVLPLRKTGAGRNMNSADSGKGSAGDVESILSGLGEILISRNLEKMMNAFREVLKPVLEQVAKVSSIVEAVEGASVDLKPVLDPCNLL